MEQRPELGQVVLQRSAGDEEAVGGLVRLQFADEAAVEVLDAMAFVLVLI